MTSRILVLVAALAVGASPLAAKSLAYEDNKINFKNCQGEDVTARWKSGGITLSQAGKSPGEPGPSVEFQTWDGSCAAFGWDDKAGQFQVKQGDQAASSIAVRFVAWDGSLWAAARTGSGFYMAKIAEKGDPDPKRHFKAAAERVLKSNVMGVPAADILAEELAKTGG
ncbi:hypothetical protein [Hyphomicrobium sp. CS1GBMeth3]|uniref:hypothetical protein n=1 Tax=Hyphomicrobium sp. CS1GBMeth3 TaxID=1892845 RepID=UPI000930FC58|nr:hypothetical protein [Hyphomicrobium sp. CS1GBMeth3]